MRGIVRGGLSLPLGRPVLVLIGTIITIFVKKYCVGKKYKQPTFLGETHTGGLMTLILSMLSFWLGIVISSETVSVECVLFNDTIIYFWVANFTKIRFSGEIASRFFLDSNLTTLKSFFKACFETTIS